MTLTNNNECIISESDVRGMVIDIARGMQADGWKPDYIVGLVRGGLIPATMLSHYLECPMYALKIALRDGEAAHDNESNWWMAEDAWGYQTEKKNILIVDDICDTGATFAWLKKDWESAVAGIIDPMSSETSPGCIWHNNVRFAALINNKIVSSAAYVGTEINRARDQRWFVFPWERWWCGN